MSLNDKSFMSLAKKIREEIMYVISPYADLFDKKWDKILNKKESLYKLLSDGRSEVLSVMHWCSLCELPKPEWEVFPRNNTAENK